MMKSVHDFDKLCIFDRIFGRLCKRFRCLLAVLLAFGMLTGAGLITQIDVRASEAKKIELNYMYAECYIGHAKTITLKNAGEGVRWKIEDSSLAKIKAKGNKVTVTGKKEGKTTLTASYRGILYKCTIDVKKSGLSTSGSVVLTVGKKKNIYYYGVPKTTKSYIHEWNDRAGGEIDNDDDIYWEVEDPSIASIKVNSYNSITITAKKSGHTEFAATYGGWTTHYTILVDEKPVVKLSETSLSLYTDREASLTLKNTGKNKVKWSASNKCVEISGSGAAVTIRGKKAGTTTIKAVCKKKTYKCTVTVKKLKEDSDYIVGADAAGNDFPENNYKYANTGYTEYGQKVVSDAEINGFSRDENTHIATGYIGLYTNHTEKEVKAFIKKLTWTVEDIDGKKMKQYYAGHVSSDKIYKKPKVQNIQYMPALQAVQYTGDINRNEEYANAIVAKVKFYEYTREVKVTAKYKGKTLATWVVGNVTVKPRTDEKIYNKVRKEMEKKLWNSSMSDVKKLQAMADYLRKKTTLREVSDITLLLGGDSSNLGMVLKRIQPCTYQNAADIMLDCAEDLGLYGSIIRDSDRPEVMYVEIYTSEGKKTFNPAPGEKV